MFDINRLSSHQQGELLAQITTPEQQIHISQHRHYRWLYFDDQAIQAAIDLHRPEQLLLHYNQAMTLAAALSPQPQRLLNLGCATGSFERFFHHYLPQLEITAIDNNAAVIELGQRFFGYPAEVELQTISAEAFLATNAQSFDWIYCDLHQQGQHPSCLQQTDFHARIRQQLNPGGVYVINLMPANNQQLLNWLLPIRQNFDHCLLLNLAELQNVILFALNQPAIRPEQRLHNARLWQQQCGLVLQPLLDQLVSLPIPAKD